MHMGLPHCSNPIELSAVKINKQAQFFYPERTVREASLRPVRPEPPAPCARCTFAQGPTSHPFPLCSSSCYYPSHPQRPARTPHPHGCSRRLALTVNTGMYSSSDEGTRSSDGAEGTPLSRGTSRDSEGSETFKPCHCGEKKAPGQLGLAQQQDGGNGGSQVSMHDPTAREWASEMLRESMRGSSEDDEYRPLAEEYDRTVCHGYYPPGFSSLHTEITNWNEGNQNPRKMYCFSCGGPGTCVDVDVNMKNCQ